MQMIQKSQLELEEKWLFLVRHPDWVHRLAWVVRLVLSDTYSSLHYHWPKKVSKP